MSPDDILAKATGDNTSVWIVRSTDLPDSQANAVLEGAIVAEPSIAVLDVAGPGAVACMQGLLTNDIGAPGGDAFVFGAVLTTKGMIVSDLWAARREGDITLFPPLPGQGPLADAFKRFLPPRLALVTDRTEELAVLRVAGPRALESMERTGIAIPAPGHRASVDFDGVPCDIARPQGDEPFTFQITAPRPDISRVTGLLEAVGITLANDQALELARILHGWPRLGAEIDGKTLPQEVRFDEIDGVSYSKGCYTGQETVARVHFRGHTNRHLTGLRWTDGQPNATAPEINRGEKVVGRVTSVAWTSRSDQPIGLGVVRREVGTGEPVIAGGAPALTAELPF